MGLGPCTRALEQDWGLASGPDRGHAGSGPVLYGTPLPFEALPLPGSTTFPNALPRMPLDPFVSLSPLHMQHIHTCSFFDSLSPASGPMYVAKPSMDTLVAHLLEQCPARGGTGAAAGAAAGGGGGAGAGGDEDEGGGGWGEGANTLRLNTRVRKARFTDGKWYLAGERVQVRGEWGMAGMWECGKGGREGGGNMVGWARGQGTRMCHLWCEMWRL